MNPAKKHFLTVVLAIAVIGLAIGIFIHSWITTQQESSPSAMTAGKNSGKASGAAATKSTKGALLPDSVPPEIVKAIKAALPDASITTAQENKGKYKLKLAWGAKTGSAKFKTSGPQTTGSISENLPVSDMPANIAEAFKAAVPDRAAEHFAKVTFAGGSRDGEMVYQWDWGNNCDGEASLDGSQISMADEMASDQLPAAITEAVTKSFPQASLAKKAMRMIENGAVTYHFDIKPAGGGKKVKVTATTAGVLTWK